jgi:hypothetical protein
LKGLEQKFYTEIAQVLSSSDPIRKLDNFEVSNNEREINKKEFRNKGTKSRPFHLLEKKEKNYTMPLCHFDSYNLWILKPTHLNRGRGIHVFRDMETCHKLIKQYC